jgi:hypothetical protein
MIVKESNREATRAMARLRGVTPAGVLVVLIPEVNRVGD